ncbi:MAG: hypothetical protein MJ158_00010 [Alphaproteobacteria bacterium]|nr:hypothetical protein [Alphaproteobacteria bacterium]
MNDLNLPIAFLDIEDLAQRWKCRTSIIEALAETGEIRLYLRPAAIEIALARSQAGPCYDLLQKLSKLYIDHRYIYLMFKNKNQKIEISHIGNYDMKTILEAPFFVGFFDLVIPMEQVENFEVLYRNIPHTDNAFELISDDFTCFIWCGQEYKFGEQQAKVIKRLWQARENGNPWMYGKRILKDIDSTSDRIKDIFSHNKYWRRIIKSDQNGKYKLNLPPKQLSLFN